MLPYYLKVLSFVEEIKRKKNTRKGREGRKNLETTVWELCNNFSGKKSWRSLSVLSSAWEAHANEASCARADGNVNFSIPGLTRIFNLHVKADGVEEARHPLWLWELPDVSRILCQSTEIQVSLLLQRSKYGRDRRNLVPAYTCVRTKRKVATIK